VGEVPDAHAKAGLVWQMPWGRRTASGTALAWQAAQKELQKGGTGCTAGALGGWVNIEGSKHRCMHSRGWVSKEG